MDKKVDYTKLKEMLEKDFTWPILYMFKFIIPADNHKLALVEAIFDEEAIITIRQSRTNKFVSVTAKEVMLSPDAVIDIYKKAEKIEGIIAL